ncbi:MAG: hypothetical protein K2Z25_01025 [Beijerinckiaceae bacterium]|nr:hypothetical protein [Beijerinckiaceae bacterium]
MVSHKPTLAHAYIRDDCGKAANQYELAGDDVRECTRPGLSQVLIEIVRWAR